MTPASLCRQGFTAEDVAAWRGGALDPAPAAAFRAHLAACQLCAAQIAQYDAVARHLRGQRVPNLQSRVWRLLAPRLRQSQQGALRMGSVRRSLSAGVIATLVVALAVVVFVQVLGHGRGVGANPTATASATGGYGSMPAAQLWGSAALQTALPEQLPNGQVFSATDIFPNGQALVGTVHPADNGPNVSAQVATYALNGAITPLYTATGAGLLADVRTDGRYVAWVFPAPSGSSAQVAGYADTQSGVVTNLGNQNQTAISAGIAVDHGYLAWADAPSGSVNVINLATGAEQSLGVHAQGALQISWPELIYLPKDNSQGYHMYNLQTGANRDLTTPKGGTTGAPFTDNSILYWENGSAGIWAITYYDRPTQLSGGLVYTLPSPDVRWLSANGRVILWQDATGAYAYDRTLTKIAQLPIFSNSSDHTFAAPLLHGAALVFQSPSGGAFPNYTIVPTGQLPTK